MTLPDSCQGPLTSLSHQQSLLTESGKQTGDSARMSTLQERPMHHPFHSSKFLEAGHMRFMHEPLRSDSKGPDACMCHKQSVQDGFESWAAVP